jgi:NTP pyrophosphatase (non-canonical NTP hydrolase)
MTTEQKVIQWAIYKGIFSSDNLKNQTLKMTAEAGEVADAVLKGDADEIRMEIGDVLVTLTLLCGMQGYTIEDALQAAYNKIKDRKGKTVGGTFIKE